MENLNLNEESKKKIIENASNEIKQRDFYEKLRDKINTYINSHPKIKYTEYILLLPDLFHLVCKLFKDERVPTKNKVYLGLAIVYCVNPIDVIPDIIPGGFGDDMVLVIKTLSDLLNVVDHKVIYDNWVGKENIVNVILDLSKLVGEYINNKTIINKIMNFIKKL